MIDFAAIAARFAEEFAFQATRATAALQAIKPVLMRRREAARAVELATKDFPIVRFYDGAVTLRLPPSQRGILTLTPPPPSLGEELARGGLGFVRGVAKAAEPFRATSQATAIARFAASFDAALADVEASVRRFERPGPEMFDPNRRQASDLFGLAALAFRSLADASRQGGDIERFTAELRGTLNVLGIGPAAGAASQPEPAAQPLPERLDAAAFELVSAIVIVGALPSLVDLLLRGIVLRLKMEVLNGLSGLEAFAREMRAFALTTAFAGLTSLADRAFDLVGGLHEVLSANVMFELRFWRAFGTALAEGVRDFVAGLAGFLQDVVALLRALPGLLDAVTRFDLTLLLRPYLSWGVRLLPDLRLGDLLDASGEHLNVDRRQVWMDWIDNAEDLIDLTPPIVDIIPPASRRVEYARRQLGRVRRLVEALFPGGGLAIRVPPLPEAPRLRFRSEFPQLGEILFGGGRAERIRTALDRLEQGMSQAWSTRLAEAGQSLGDLATTFGAAAAESARNRSAGRLERVAAHVGAMAAGVFGPEVERERERLRERPEDALARAFEGWLATGGFLLIGEVIPTYVEELARHWRAQIAEGTELTAPITPTSPHILRRRATLGRVTVPRLVLRAPGRELDETLADDITSHFADAVRGAYGTGEARLRELAGAQP